MVWSNLALAWAGDPLAALREVHRVLIAGGLLMFSSYGPDTLKELKAAFGADSVANTCIPSSTCTTSAMLVASGFAAPVADMEVITLTTRGPGTYVTASLRGDLCARDRQRSLLGRRAWRTSCLL
jgi:malonyl-CoA O-methyltransferase